MSTYTALDGGHIRIYDSSEELRPAVTDGVNFSDNGVLSDLSTQARADDATDTGGTIAVAAEDALYVGAAAPFARIKVGMSGSFSSAGALVLSYWDGSAWSTVPDFTDGTSDGTDAFAQDGYIHFNPPALWSAGDGGITGLGTSLYYVKIEVTTNPSGAIDFDQLWPVDGQYFDIMFDEMNLTAPEGRPRPEETVRLHRGRHSTHAHYTTGPDTVVAEPLELSFSARCGNVFTKTMMAEAASCGNPDYDTNWDATGVSTKTDTSIISGEGSSVTTPAFEDSTKKAVCVQLVWEKGGVSIGRAFHECWFDLSQLSLAESEEGVILSFTALIYGPIQRIHHFAYRY